MSYGDFLAENPLYTGDVDDDLTDATSCDPPIFQAHRKREALEKLRQQLEVGGLVARPTSTDNAAHKHNTGNRNGNGTEPDTPEETNFANPKKRPSSTLNGAPTAKRPASGTSASTKKIEKSDTSSSMDIIPTENQIRPTRSLRSRKVVTATESQAQATSGSNLDPKIQNAIIQEMDEGLSELLAEETFGDKECAFGEEIEGDMTNALSEAKDRSLNGLTPAAVNAPPLIIPASNGASTVISTISLAGDDDGALEFDASDIPDEAVEEYLNTPAEAAVKEIIWTELHKEYLEDQAEKMRLEEQLRAEGKEIPKKRSRSRKANASGANSGSAGAPLGDEILIEPIKERSKKLNYEALDRAKQMRMASSRSTRAWLEENWNDDGTMDTMDDIKEPFGTTGLQKPPPSAYLGSLKPTIPDPASQHTTQTTQKYDDYDDEDEDEPDEDRHASEFNQHFRSNYEEDYEEY